MLPPRLRVRYKRLIGLLEGHSDIPDEAAAGEVVVAILQFSFGLSPVPLPNLFIIEDPIGYEGMKRAGTV